MKLFIDIVMKRIYLFNTVAWNYRKKIGFPVCKKENFAGLQAHRKSGKSARASPTPQHTLNEERSARFIALSALIQAFDISVPFSLLICSLGDRGGDNCSLLYQTKVPVLVSINRLKLVPDKWIVPVLFFSVRKRLRSYFVYGDKRLSRNQSSARRTQHILYITFILS